MGRDKYRDLVDDELIGYDIPNKIKQELAIELRGIVDDFKQAHEFMHKGDQSSHTS